MADWYGAARTNYFPVKNAEAFKAWAIAASLRPCQSATSELWYLLSEDQYGGWPSEVWEDGADDGRDFDIVAELAGHVVEGWPVILMESGAEKLRYISGAAIAFRVTDGEIEREQLVLDDIHDIAEQRWGISPTRCAY